MSQSDNNNDRVERGVEGLPTASQSAERTLTIAGVVLPIIGMLIIAFAGYQAGGTVYVADQIPMLITGGVLGLGLILIGVALFVRYSVARLLRFWMARVSAEQQLQTERLIEALKNQR